MPSKKDYLKGHSEHTEPSKTENKKKREKVVGALPQNQLEFDAVLGVSLAAIGAKNKIPHDEVEHIFMLIMWAVAVGVEITKRDLFDLRMVDDAEVLCSEMGMDRKTLDKIVSLYRNSIKSSDNLFGRSKMTANDAWKLLYGEDKDDANE